MQERCIFRDPTQSISSPGLGSGLSSIQKTNTFQCRILKDKGLPDTVCYNLDLSHSTCPISPLKISRDLEK